MASRGTPRTHARGALLGLAVGDALGATLEFQPLPPRPFTPLLTGPHTDVIGGGPFGVEPGQGTDDTQMAACLGTSLLARGGFDARDVAQRYRSWVPTALDAGNLTRQALAERGPVEDAGRRAWEANGRTSAGNGSLMRTAPLAVFYAHDAEARRRASLAESALTHADPRCLLACAAFNTAVAAAIAQPAARTALQLVEVAEVELEAAAAHLTRTWGDVERETREALQSLRADLAAARADDPDLYGAELHLTRGEGFVRVAFRLAFWELVHAPSAQAALLDAVNRGGDSDTNGAITGALVGAFHGEDALPAAWRERVLKALWDAPGDRNWKLYHPRLLLPLADRLAG